MAPPDNSCKRMEDAATYMNESGPIYISSRDNSFAYAFQIDERHVNLGGVCHGGMLLAFASEAFRHLAASNLEGGKPQMVSLQSSFVRPGRSGDYVEVSPRIVEKTRTTLFLEGRFEIGGKVAFVASSVWQISPA